jgi:hypothetical protein
VKLNRASLLTCILFSVLIQFSSAQAEFASRKVRYASTYDILNLLNKNFPGNGQDRAVAISMKCDAVTEVNRDVLGGSNSVSGQPLMEKPNPGFIRWLNQCLTEYTKFEFAPADAYRGDFAKSYLPKSLQSEAVGVVMKRKWTSLAPEVRTALIDRLARRMVGPPAVYRVYSGDKPWGDFTSSIEKTVTGLISADATVANAMANVAQTIFLRDEFLRY